MMNNVKRQLLYGAVAMSISAVLLTAPSLAQVDRFKQWIAPLECTQSRIVDGNTIKVILTPEECDEFLHPKPPETPDKDDTKNPSWTPHTPGAPNTGFFQDPIVGFIQSGFWLLVFVGLIAFARRRKDGNLPE